MSKGNKKDDDGTDDPVIDGPQDEDSDSGGDVKGSSPADPVDNTFNRFKNRRRMAWIALLAILIATGLLMFLVDESRLSKLETPIVWFYMGMTSIVATYMGTATYEYSVRDKLKLGK